MYTVHHNITENGILTFSDVRITDLSKTNDLRLFSKHDLFYLLPLSTILNEE
jgi:hypothetical protein